MKLHLGCGSKHLSGWVHVDACAHPHVDIVTTVDKLDTITDQSVSEIYACHVLEHVGRRSIVAVLCEWHRVLSIGGTLRIAVPDWDAIVEHYQTTRRLVDVYGLLVGGQRDEYDYHNVHFNFELLQKMLMYCGFEDIKRYEWQEFLPEGFDDYSRCYLPHMDTVNGRLMSLNIVATKRSNGVPTGVPTGVLQVIKQ
jgi:predicted SAM-dependent methyltransferase